MSSGTDEVCSVSSHRSSSKHNSPWNKFQRARNTVEQLQAELCEAKVDIGVLKRQLRADKDTVSTLVHRLALLERRLLVDAPQIPQEAAAASVPARPPSPPARDRSPRSRPSPPLLPDPDSRWVIPDLRLGNRAAQLERPSRQNAAPSRTSVLDRLGLPATDADRSSGLRRGHLRDLRSPSPQRRSGPSRGPGAPPVSSEPPPLQFPAGTAGIRPGYRH